MNPKSKVTRILNRMDQRWKTEEKIFQYKGLVRIFERERRKELNDARRFRRKQEKQINELRKDCTYFRLYLGNSLHGNKQRIRNALQSKCLFLAYQGLLPDKVIEHFEHSNNKQQRTLDLLRYKKHQRMEIFTDLKMEIAELKDRLEAGSNNSKFRRKVQMLSNGMQNFAVRQSAAAQVHKLYQNILYLLRKDSYYFDSMLKLLHSDCEEQCHCICRATELGELTQEELEDNRDEYRRLEKVVRSSIKDRDHEVRKIEKGVEELNHKCRILSRVESFTYVYRASPSSSDVLAIETKVGEEDVKDIAECESEMLEIEKLMQNVRDANLAPTLCDVYPRIVCQVSQEETLLRQIAKIKDFRNEMLHMKNQAEMTLASISHHVATSSLRYTEETKRLSKEIDDENYRLEREQDAIEEYAEMLVDLRMALHGMLEMVNRVKEISTESSISSESSEVIVLDVSEKRLEEVEKTLLPPMEQDHRRLLHMVGNKLEEILMHFTDAVDEETVASASMKQRRQALEKRTRLLVHDVYDVPLFEDPETEEIGTMSREDIKHQSKQLIVKHEEALEMALMKPRIRAKHVKHTRL